MTKTPKGKEAFDIHRTLPNRKSVSPAPPKPLRDDNPPARTTDKRRGSSFKRGLIFSILIILLFTLTIGVWDAVALSRASKKMFGNGNLFSLIGGNLDSNNGRTNILMAGYSADDTGHDGAMLTDSIMLISLDNHTKTGYQLSIPRDLWVNIPGYGHSKINEAYQDGERDGFNQTGYPAGGMGLLESIISDKFGVPINYYALVDYAAFRDTVNAVGGITINIKSTDPRGIYDPSVDYTSLTCCALANYPNGPAKLNGKQALNLARARGDAYNSYGFDQADFDRTEHQRQMLAALKAKAFNWGVIFNPIKAGHIFDGMATNVKTDIDTGNVFPLFSLVKHTGDLKSLSLRDFNGKNYLISYGGALIPTAGINDFSDIQAAITQLNK